MVCGWSDPFSEIFQFDLQYCKCVRRLRRKDVVNDIIMYNQTTCGLDAFNRGPGQKIVGFSYWKPTGLMSVLR